MANQLNEFDKLIKESLDGYEAPYDPMHWEELEEELNLAVPSFSSFIGAFTTGVVLTSVVFIGMLLFNSTYFGKMSHQEELVAEDELGSKGPGIHASTEIQEVESKESPNIYSEDIIDTDESESENSKQSVKDVDTSIIVATKPDNNWDSETEPVVSGNENTLPEEVDNSPKVRTGCTGLTIDFNASEEYGKDASYLWNFGDGFFSNESNPSHTFNKEGVFDVSLSVTSPSSGQITSNVVQAMIEVVEAPIANLELDIESPDVVKLGNKSYNATEIQWKLDDEIISAKPAINVSLADNTHYQLALIAYNEGGCSDTLQAIVNSVIAGNEFPKAYETSYGTSFAPGAIIDDGEVTSIKIFEKKTGKMVFDGSGSKGWEGKNLDGSEAVPGKYEWVMLVNKSDAIDIYHGDIEYR